MKSTITIPSNPSTTELIVASACGLITGGPLGAVLANVTLRGTNGKWFPWLLAGVVGAPASWVAQAAMIASLGRVPTIPGHTPSSQPSNLQTVSTQPFVDPQLEANLTRQQELMGAMKGAIDEVIALGGADLPTSCAATRRASASYQELSSLRWELPEEKRSLENVQMAEMAHNLAGMNAACEGQGL